MFFVLSSKKHLYSCSLSLSFSIHCQYIPHYSIRWGQRGWRAWGGDAGLGRPHVLAKREAALLWDERDSTAGDGGSEEAFSEHRGGGFSGQLCLDNDLLHQHKKITNFTEFFFFYNTEINSSINGGTVMLNVVNPQTLPNTITNDEQKEIISLLCKVKQPTHQDSFKWLATSICLHFFFDCILSNIISPVLIKVGQLNA